MRVCTACLDKIDLQKIDLNHISLISITCDPSVYTTDHPDLIYILLLYGKQETSFVGILVFMSSLNFVLS